MENQSDWKTYKITYIKFVYVKSLTQIIQYLSHNTNSATCTCMTYTHGAPKMEPLSALSILHV